MKKRGLILGLSVLLVFAFNLAGCKSQENDNNTTGTVIQTTTQLDSSQEINSYSDTCEVKLNPYIEQVVRNYKHLNDSDFITKAMLEEFEEFRIVGEPIEDLTGIEYFVNVKDIEISHGRLKDASALGKLPKLETVNLNFNYIEEIPDLSACENIKELNMSYNMVRDISPLNNYKHLDYVNLCRNKIFSIEPLKDNHSIDAIQLCENCVMDFASIKDNEDMKTAIYNGGMYEYEDAMYLENLTKDIVDEITRDCESDIEKEAAIAVYIQNISCYVDNNAKHAEFAYEILVNHEGVCVNYAEAYCMLARRANLNCEMIYSEDHAWNVVNIDGQWYHVDALWDQGYSDWNHFNRSTEFITTLVSHQYDLDKYPYAPEDMERELYVNYIPVAD